MFSYTYCVDTNDAVIKSFFGTLKSETIYLQKVKLLTDLIRTIDEYFYWYNHERIKLTSGVIRLSIFSFESINYIIIIKNIKYNKMVSIQNIVYPVVYRIYQERILNFYQRHKYQKSGISHHGASSSSGAKAEFMVP